MCRKVSSDWLPSCIKVTRPGLEILNMAGYFPGIDIILLGALGLTQLLTEMSIRNISCRVKTAGA